MRRVRYNVAASLDGFIADPDGGFGWIPHDPEIDFAEIFARVDTVLIGRRSFEAMREMGGPPVWPAGTRVFVFSRTLRAADHPDVTVVGVGAQEVVAGLRSEPGDGDIWLFGGGSLFGSLLTDGLVDSLEIAVVPVLLGGGVPLLPPGASRTTLTLTDTRTYPSGIVVLTYAPAR